MPRRRKALKARSGFALFRDALDVYEEEAKLFFEDNSNKVLQDDVFARLTTFKNVVITGHQAFFTVEAMQAIANTTIANVLNFEKGDFDKVFLAK